MFVNIGLIILISEKSTKCRVISVKINWLDESTKYRVNRWKISIYHPLMSSYPKTQPPKSCLQWLLSLLKIFDLIMGTKAQVQLNKCVSCLDSILFSPFKFPSSKKSVFFCFIGWNLNYVRSHVASLCVKWKLKGKSSQ